MKIIFKILYFLPVLISSAVYSAPLAYRNSNPLCNRYRQTADFTDGKQWLLRFFDQIRFYPVSTEELTQMREDFVVGRFQLVVEETTLKLADYSGSLVENQEFISSFKNAQQAAFDAERLR